MAASGQRGVAIVFNIGFNWEVAVCDYEQMVTQHAREYILHFAPLIFLVITYLKMFNSVNDKEKRKYRTY